MTRELQFTEKTVLCTAVGAAMGGIVGAMVGSGLGMILDNPELFDDDIW